MPQFCPQVSDLVPAKKCNRCNVELVGRMGYCCEYINCLDTCDYSKKEGCVTYQQKLKLKQLETEIKRSIKSKEVKNASSQSDNQ